MTGDIGKILRRRKKTLAVAESCTGGLLGHRLTRTPGASDYFIGGVIAYHNRVKQGLLGVPPRTLREHGAVSAQTAKAMAKSVRSKMRSDLGLAITGIAGPGGGTRKKPVGLVYIAFSDRKRVLCKEFHFSGTRETVRTRAVERALALLKKILSP